ncbi:MAG: HlyD family type I secretion periplasmic adaptor subunit [Halioglobus sp.]
MKRQDGGCRLLGRTLLSRAGFFTAPQSQLRNQFVPAALAVQETPPSPLGRCLMWVLLALFAIGILWVSIGEVDIVVTAPGRIVPTGQVKILQAAESGTVVSIHIRDGDRVEAGQTLIRFDSTSADADSRRVSEQINTTTLQYLWRQALAKWFETGRTAVDPIGRPQTVSDTDYQKAEQIYRQHRAEISAKLNGFDKELAANSAEQKSARAERNRTEAVLGILKQRVKAYKALLDKQYGAKSQYLEILQQQIELEHSIPVLVSREQQLVQTAAAIATRITAMTSELRKQNLMEILGLESNLRMLKQELRKARQRQRHQLLVSPVAGTVQELALHTLGGVVTPAQPLLKIVPEHSTIEVEALLQNKDIGFVREGQKAELKINTFNFTKYGLINAAVVNISNDAVEDKQLGWVYKMNLELQDDTIEIDGVLVKLSPGMLITTEIKTGKRRLIEFFLSPLLRYRQESVRER